MEEEEKDEEWKKKHHVKSETSECARIEATFFANGKFIIRFLMLIDDLPKSFNSMFAKILIINLMYLSKIQRIS